MAITIISQPEAIFPAYNPAPLVLKASNSEAEVTLRFWVDGSVVATHKREFFTLAEPLTDNFGNPIVDNDGMPIPIGGDSLAVFDLGKIARNYFSNAKQELHPNAYRDRRLCVPFEIEIESPALFTLAFTAFNAALPPGVAESAFVDRKNTFLTEFAEFKYYPGFSDKSELTVLSESAQIGYIKVTISGALTSPLDEDVFIFGFTYEGVEREVSGTPSGGGIIDQIVYSLFDMFGIVAARTEGLDYFLLPEGITEISLSWDAPQTGAGVTTTVDYFASTTRYVTYNYAGLTIVADVASALDSAVSVSIPTLNPLLMPPSFDLTEGSDTLDSVPINLQRGYLCEVQSPFYVRWVSRIVGKEHWMFSRRQTDKTEIDNSVTYDPYIDTNADLGRFPRQLSLTSEHTIVVGAEGISNADFDVLRRITTSPLIEYYDEETEKWMVITIKNGTTSKDTALPTQAIEFEFILPPPALQF